MKKKTTAAHNIKYKQAQRVQNPAKAFHTSYIFENNFFYHHRRYHHHHHRRRRHFLFIRVPFFSVTVFVTVVNNRRLYLMRLYRAWIKYICVHCVYILYWIFVEIIASKI